MSSVELERIEASIKSSQKLVDIGESLERLCVNRDFKRVILEGYFEQEAIRLVHLKSDPNMQSVDSQKSILAQIDAVGALSQYFYLLRHNAMQAGKTIIHAEETREEILAEGAE